MPQLPIATPVLLLSESEQAASLDRRALRDAGFVNTHVMTSGIEAAKYLANLNEGGNGRPPELVVCSQKLEDMDGDQFCAIVRRHPRLIALPILLVLPNDSEAEQLLAQGCGASAIVGRPYSVDTLRARLEKLAAGYIAGENPGPEADTSEFDAALASYGILLRPSRQPEDYFRAGMKCLEEKRWNVAMAAFQNILAGGGMKAEAQLGIAAAYKGKGDMARFGVWLGNAAETLVKDGRWNLARATFARLLQRQPEAKNPFLTEAHRLIRLKEYEQAAETLAQGVSIIPKSRAAEKLAMVCMSAEDPQAMLKILAASLEREDKKNDYLNGEIRQSLELLCRARSDRLKMRAAERKWQLSRQMAEKKKSQSAPMREEAEKPAAVKLVEESPDQQAQGEIIAGNFAEADEGGTGNSAIILESLGHEDDNDASNKSGLNDFLSVVRLTWKLARRSGKNKK